MFASASSFSQDLRSWSLGTAGITSMRGMFFGATSFDCGHLVGWSSLGKEWMFTSEELKEAMEDWMSVERRAECEEFYGSIEGWDVSAFRSMAFLFRCARDFKDDISGWDVSSVEKVRGMFMGASRFDKGGIAAWKERSGLRGRPLSSEELKEAVRVWFEDRGVAELFYGHISDWDVSEVTDMSWLFTSKSAFNEGISRWDGEKESARKEASRKGGVVHDD